MDSPSSSNVTKEIKELGRTKWWRRIVCMPDCCNLFMNESHSIASTTRVYHVWPGNNVFFFRGRIIFGPDPRGFVLTTLSIVLSSWIFCVYIGGTLGEHSALIIVVCVILTVIAIVDLVLVGTRDPGIVPRNEKPPLEQMGSGIKTRSLRISVDGVDVKVKYCRICKIIRPPRASHCAVCDNCVEKFDHHCPWISQCVGLRNYRYYILFIVSALVFFLYIFIFSWWRMRRKLSEAGSGFLGAFRSSPETLALLFFSFIAIWFLGGLVSFHVYLTARNQTARENFKGRYANSRNPYDKGVLRNTKEALFTRLPPSKVNLRTPVEPEFNSIARLLMNLKETGNGSNFSHRDAAEDRDLLPKMSSESEHYPEVRIEIKS